MPALRREEDSRSASTSWELWWCRNIRIDLRGILPQDAVVKFPGVMVRMALWLWVTVACVHAERPRVIVSTDIGGGDPDDFQSMVHYLVYADRFDTEGLISSPPKQGRASDLLECLEAYAADYGRLRTWSEDYPSPASLRALSKQGATESQKGEIPSAMSVGAEWIVAMATREDPRPLHVLVWGALTDVAQAVHAKPEIKSRLRIYSIGSWNTRNGQRERDYLTAHHGDLWWIESDTTFRGMYMGGEQEGDLGNVSFPAQHVAGHGALGALFMRKKKDIKMGDSPSVLYLLHGDLNDPTSASWGGAYVRPDPEHRPTYWHDDPNPEWRHRDRPGARSVNRWRREYLRDWQKCMDRALAVAPSTPSSE